MKETKNLLHNKRNDEQNEGEKIFVSHTSKRSYTEYISKIKNLSNKPQMYQF
jgi:hypothetical protein